MTSCKPDSYEEHDLKRRAAHIMHDHFSINPHATCTELAENAAAYLNHDEWLDNPEHWIWDRAFAIGGTE